MHPLQKFARTERASDDVFRILAVSPGGIRRSPHVDELLRAQVPAVFDRASVNVLVVSTGSPQVGQGEDASRDSLVSQQPAQLSIGSMAIHETSTLRQRDVWRAALVLATDRRRRDLTGTGLLWRRATPFTVVEFALVLEHLASSEGQRVAPLGPDGFPAFMRRVVAAAQGALTEVLGRDAVALDLPGLDDGPHQANGRAVEALDEHILRIVAALRALGAR